jgi:hypothetical protein
VTVCFRTCLRSHIQMFIFMTTVISIGFIFYVNDRVGDRAHNSLNSKLNLYVFYKLAPSFTVQKDINWISMVATSTKNKTYQYYENRNRNRTVGLATAEE